MSELTTLFKNTADAIRSKTGDTATMKASQFPAKIQGISVGISQDEADARYLQLSGGTMTGDLKVQESPASDKSAVSKSYAQGLFASALPKSGGTMTGNLILNGAPTADNQAATKAYVDDKAGGRVLIGEVNFSPNSNNYQTYSVRFPYNSNIANYGVLLWELTLNATERTGYSTVQVDLGFGDDSSGYVNSRFAIVNVAPGSTFTQKCVMYLHDISSNTLYYFSPLQDELNNKIYFNPTSPNKMLTVHYNEGGGGRVTDTLNIKLYGLY